MSDYPPPNLNPTTFSVHQPFPTQTQITCVSSSTGHTQHTLDYELDTCPAIVLQTMETQAKAYPQLHTTSLQLCFATNGPPPPVLHYTTPPRLLCNIKEHSVPSHLVFVSFHTTTSLLGLCHSPLIPESSLPQPLPHTATSQSHANPLILDQTTSFSSTFGYIFYNNYFCHLCLFTTSTIKK